MTQNDDVMPQPASIDSQRPHKPADDTEEVYYQGSPLLRGEIGRFLLFVIFGLVLMVGPILLRTMADVHVPWWLLLASIAIGALLIAFPVMMLKTVTYRISNYRIDYERGVFSKNIDTLELWHVEDVRLHQSLMDRILNCGTITIVSHDETTPELQMHGLPNPRPLFETLKQRIIAVKRQRGVVKMDVG